MRSSPTSSLVRTSPTGLSTSSSVRVARRPLARASADYVQVGTVTNLAGQTYVDPYSAAAYDVPGGVSSFRVLTNLPEHTQTYDGLELSLVKRMANRWMFRCSEATSPGTTGRRKRATSSSSIPHRSGRPRACRLPSASCLLPRPSALNDYTSPMQIRHVADDDAEDYLTLRRESLLDSPLAFSASPGDDFMSTPDALRGLLRTAPDWIIVGAFDRTLIGAAGIFRVKRLKAAHLAWLWGMYVTPSHRGRGVAAQILAAAIAHSRSLPGVASVRLSVTTATPGARRLYERAGFVFWGNEPDALRHDGISVVEQHMTLDLPPS